MSDADIDKMVKDAEANAEADKKKKELVEARNQADALIHTTEKTLKENADKVSSGDKDNIENAIKDLKTALDADNLDQIKSKTEALMQASMKLGEAMYKAQQSTADAGAAQGASTGEQQKDEKVVDADFEEVK